MLKSLPSPRRNFRMRGLSDCTLASMNTINGSIYCKRVVLEKVSKIHDHQIFSVGYWSLGLFNNLHDYDPVQYPIILRRDYWDELRGCTVNTIVDVVLSTVRSGILLVSVKCKLFYRRKWSKLCDHFVVIDASAMLLYDSYIPSAKGIPLRQHWPCNEYCRYIQICGIYTPFYKSN